MNALDNAVLIALVLPLIGVGLLQAVQSPRAWPWVAATFALLDALWCLWWAAAGVRQSNVAIALAVNAVIAVAVVVGQPRRGLVLRDVVLPLVWLSSGVLVMAADDVRLVLLGWLSPLLAVALSLRTVSERESRARLVVWRMLVLGCAPLVVAAFLFVRAGLEAHAATPWLISTWKADWLAPGLAGAVFLLVALAVMVRLGVPPTHAWLPTLSEVLPAGTMLALTSVQMSVHVMVRLGLGPLPHALPSERLVVLGLGLFGVVWAALIAASQHRLKRIIAFVTASQSSALLTGLALGELVGVSGALTNAISVALATRGLMLVAGAIESRVGPVDVRQFTGLSRAAPRLATVAVMLTFAAIGLPGTLGFVGEDLLLQGLIHEWPVLAAVLVASFALLGIVLLRTMFKTCFGPASTWHSSVPDLLPRERVLLALAAGLLVLGVWPAPLVRAHRADAELLLRAAGPEASAPLVQASR